MKTGVKILLSVIGIVVLLVVIAGLFGYFKYLREDTDVAFLSIKAGAVEVDSGKGWMKASDGMKLSLRDRVKTLGNGIALIVLYESILVTLDPNTEVSINSLAKDNVVVKQESGSTWNKFSDLAGVASYQIETPTTVATVRGTGFNVLVSDDESAVDVGEGVVYVLANGDMLKVGENMRALKKKGEKLVEARMEPQVRMIIAKRIIQDLQDMKELRKREILKYKDILEQARKQYGFTDEQMYDYLEKIDRGEVSDEELLAKAPVKLPALQKLKKMNENIKKQRAVLEKLDMQLEKMSSEDIEKVKEQREQLRAEIREKISKKVEERKEHLQEIREDIKQGIEEKRNEFKQNLEAAALDVRLKPPEDSEGNKTIVDAEQKRQEEIEKGTAVAAVL